MAKKSDVTVDPLSPLPGVVSEREDGPDLGVAIPMPEPEGGWPADEWTGKGGSYVRDPLTGVRSQVVPPTSVDGE